MRHRIVRTKGGLSPKTAELMVFKFVNAAAETWRRLNGDSSPPKKSWRISHETVGLASPVYSTKCQNKVILRGSDIEEGDMRRLLTFAFLIPPCWMLGTRLNEKNL